MKLDKKENKSTCKEQCSARQERAEHLRWCGNTHHQTKKTKASVVNGEGLWGHLLPFTNFFPLCFPPFRHQQLSRPVTVTSNMMPSGLRGEKPPQDDSDEGRQVYWTFDTSHLYFLTFSWDEAVPPSTFMSLKH